MKLEPKESRIYIYFNDLSLEAKKDLLFLLGIGSATEMNWDKTPMAFIKAPLTVKKQPDRPFSQLVIDSFFSHKITLDGSPARLIGTFAIVPLVKSNNKEKNFTWIEVQTIIENGGNFRT